MAGSGSLRNSSFTESTTVLVISGCILKVDSTGWKGAFLLPRPEPCQTKGSPGVWVSSASCPCEGGRREWEEEGPKSRPDLLTRRTQASPLALPSEAVA